MNRVAAVGLSLLGVGAALMLIEAAWLIPRVIRVRRTAAVLRALTTSNVLQLQVALRLAESLAQERRKLLRPARFVHRWSRHPLTLALYAAYRRGRR